jgi:hypothetical protein
MEVSALYQCFRDAVILDVEESDRLTGFANLMCYLDQRGAIVAQQRADVDDGDRGKGQQTRAHSTFFQLHPRHSRSVTYRTLSAHRLHKITRVRQTATLWHVFSRTPG